LRDRARELGHQRALEMSGDPTGATRRPNLDGRRRYKAEVTEILAQEIEVGTREGVIVAARGSKLLRAKKL
jgi:hypothetical protein